MPWYRHKPYGIILDRKVDPRTLEAVGFRMGGSLATGGISKYEHFRRYANSALKIEWNSWLEWQIRSLCDDTYAYKDGETVVRSVNWTGAASAGKTFAAGLYSVLWFAADPSNSAVTLVSSSKNMLKRRVFPIVQNTYSEMCKNEFFRFGHMIESQTMLQASKGDSKHSIAGVAIQSGELQNAIENLKGIHCARVLVIIDEAPGTEEAIVETIPNIRKGCQDLTVLTIGNAISHLDIHGRCCEPAEGWPSISVESETWKTKGVPKWMLPSGRADHFDGFKSPNVIAGKTLYKYLYSYEDFRAAKANSEERQTIQIWSNDRGFWTPIGILNTIFDEVMIEKHGRGQFVWQSQSEKIASLDPAFGGDGCIFQVADYGDLPNGRFGIQLKEFISIQADPTSKDVIDYQIAHQVMMECDKRRIRPEKFAMDATGTGRGVYAVLKQEWGDVLRVEFGGAASDRVASASDSRPSCDIYDRRVTELWYSCREFLLSDQLKGLYPEAEIEFCSREYTIKKPKYVLDDKTECKKKIGRSPDHADAIAVLVELARSRLGAIPGTYTKQVDQWDKIAAKFDIYDENDLPTNDAVEEPMSWDAA